MSDITVGSAVPNFQAAATGEQTINLAQFKGTKNVVIYFYPKDSTPGCTKQGQAFRDLFDEYAQLDTVILGVSRDSIKRHENFKAKQAFPFELLSDEDETICNLFDVIKLKKNYGREYMGIERSTFLVDKEGVLRQEWRKVKVAGHVEEVLEAVKAL